MVSVNEPRKETSYERNTIRSLTIQLFLSLLDIGRKVQ